MNIQWELIRYKCQVHLKHDKKWTTIRICYRDEDAEQWLRTKLKYECEGALYRVIREEAMMIERSTI